MIAPPLPAIATRYRLVERQYGETAFRDIRFDCDMRDDYSVYLGQRQMDARAWYWHALRGADIRMDADGMGFTAVGRDGARTTLAEVRIEEMDDGYIRTGL